MNKFEFEAIQVEKVRLIVEACITKKTRIEKVRLIVETRQLQQQQQAKKTRIEKARLTKEVRITKKKIEAFVCKRCFKKYFNNIKFYEHSKIIFTFLRLSRSTIIHGLSTSLITFSSSSHLTSILQF